MSKMQRKLTLELGYEPSVAELAEALDMTEDKVMEIMQYDPRTTHSLISAQFATKYGIFKCPLRSRKTISTPEGKMLVNYIRSNVSVKINGIDFLADLLVIESMGKDVILGKNWLQRTKAVIQHRTICLETPSGERIVVEDNRPLAQMGTSIKEE